MQYVMLLDWREGLTREQREGALMRRAGWKYPEGVTVLGEYWPATESPGVVVALETDSFEPIMEIQFTWGDVFKITTHPATTPEEGLRIGPDVMGRAQAYMG